MRWERVLINLLFLREVFLFGFVVEFVGFDDGGEV